MPRTRAFSAASQLGALQVVRMDDVSPGERVTEPSAVAGRGARRCV